MVVNKKPKAKNYRGSKTHGGGSMKKRRGAGNRGGRGMAGSGKKGDAKVSKTWGTNYFGKSGFKDNKNSTSSHGPISIFRLEMNLDNFEKQGLCKKEKDVYNVDLLNTKFNKLVATGKINCKINVKIVSATKTAIEKIKNAGGEVILKEIKKEKSVKEKPVKKKSEKAED
jgi:large subunit ribosomal protein L15